jgi:hypothetical protein
LPQDGDVDSDEVFVVAVGEPSSSYRLYLLALLAQHLPVYLLGEKLLSNDPIEFLLHQ